MTAETKPLRDMNGPELRARGRAKRDSPRAEVLAELGRRRDNLRDAVIPEWERAARGEDPASWDLLR